MEYPEDKSTFTMENQYLLGRPCLFSLVNNFDNTMIASDSFVLRGNVNLVFHSLLMQEGKFSFVF